MRLCAQRDIRSRNKAGRGLAQLSSALDPNGHASTRRPMTVFWGEADVRQKVAESEFDPLRTLPRG